MENNIEINKEKLQTLVKYFYELCGICNELNIGEFEEADEEMQKMKTWVKENFAFLEKE